MRLLAPTRVISDPTAVSCVPPARAPCGFHQTGGSLGFPPILLGFFPLSLSHAMLPCPTTPTGWMACAPLLMAAASRLGMLRYDSELGASPMQTASSASCALGGKNERYSDKVRPEGAIRCASRNA